MKSIYLSIFVILFSSNFCMAASSEDYQKMDKLHKMLGQGIECQGKGLDEKEVSLRTKQTLQWVRNTFEENKDSLDSSIVRAPLYYSYLQEHGAFNQSCEQVAEEWQKFDWPQIEIKETENKPETPWRCKSATSKMDKTTNVTCFNDSINTVRNSSGDPENGALIIRCRSNQTDAYIVWPSFLGTQSKIVETKIDDQPIIKQTWGSSEDGKAVFRENPIKWIKTLQGAKSLIVRLSPYQKAPQELEFDITGIEDVIEQISEACKWKK